MGLKKVNTAGQIGIDCWCVIAFKCLSDDYSIENLHK